MQSPLINRAYVAVNITLTSANTNYNVLDLVNVVLAAEPLPSSAPGACRELSLQNAPANTASILIGDALLSASRFGYALAFGAAGVPGAQRIYRADHRAISIGDLYARSGTAGQVLSVEICVN